ncbi:hypothetical protein sS8_4979 [Methylocaldum marinum]|uniref:YhdP central domain-containing protein n=1 Tax=Methylocaldum marinum TaxID=1432792 RepID=A0A250KZ85_9GAMM|nr:YhdP family protein [Methylocaldum marinum]BBA36902.1 hypothetical protein sS8_4979 [Methylocaldum marinum]
MKSVIRFTGRTALYIGLCFIVVLALTITALRWWLFPDVSSYRHLIEAEIGSLIGETVRIENLSARLHGFHPRFSLNGFHILDAEGRPAIKFATIRVDFDPLRTLFTGQPSFGRMEIVGAKLSIRRRQDGTIGILGLHVRDQPPAWLMADGRFELLNCDLDWLDFRSSDTPLHLGRANIRLVNRNGKHKLGADIALPRTLGRNFRFTLDAQGDLFQAGEWSGKVYLEGTRIDTARIAGALPEPDFSVISGIADFRIWANWAGRLDSIAGDFELAKPVFALRRDVNTESRLALSAIESRFRWQRKNDGWRLDLHRFRPALTRAWPKTRLALALTRGTDGTPSVIRAAASYLELGDINTAFHALPLLDENAGTVLRALAPRGSARNVRFFFAADEALGKRAALCGTFENFGANAWRSLPGVSGLNGELCGTDETGRLSVSAENGQLRPNALGLKNPITLNKAKGDFFWRQTDADWWISSPSFFVENADLAARGRFGIVLPKDPKTSPFLDLRMQVGETDVATVKNYLPFAVIPKTSQWLEHALIGGQFGNTQLLFHGAIADFPFYRNEGVFESSIEAHNLALRFHPDWPPLTQTDARIRFRGPGMEIDSSNGRIGRGQIVEAHAEAEDLRSAPWLKLNGSAKAAVPDVLDFLAHSPLRELPAKLGKFVSTAGDTEISLDLTVPLDRKLGDITIEGKAEFNNAKLRLVDAGLELERINGPLRFTRTGLSADAIRASVFGHSAEIRISREKVETAVEIRGRIGVSDLREQFPNSLWRFARGATDYELDLRIPDSLDTENEPLLLSLSSTMSGLALNLPAPFGKREKTRKDLYLETDVRAGTRIPLRLSYGPAIRAELSFSKPADGIVLESGNLAIGRLLPPLGPEPGLAILAQLEELDAGEWRRLLPESPDEPRRNALLRMLELNVENIYWNGEGLGPLSLDMVREDRDWQGHLDCTFGKGTFKATDNSIVFDLAHLRLPKRDGAETKPANTGSIDPSVLPNITLNAKRLLWRNADLGPLTLRTERRAHGMIIKTLEGGTENHRFDMHGRWTRSADKTWGTHLAGKIRVEDLGDLLAGVGYGGEVRDTPSDIDFRVSWLGAPQQFSPAGVAGDIRMKLGKGAILKIEPGFGRVLGMLNLDTLWRRLSFDFSDLFGKGLAYDNVLGTFQLGGGQAVTKGFLIDAVPAKIVINGRAGLVTRDLDQIVTVIPHTSVALPIAGALAGGPAVGAAVLLAQQLVGEEVDSITATHYAVKGSWDEPQITKISSNMPLDILDRAWSGMKDLSGFGTETEKETNE